MGGVPEFVFHLDSDRRRQKVIDALNSVPHDGTYDVEIRKHSDDCSWAQRKLKWKWASEFGRQYGITKDKANRQFKWRHCRPILIRDDPTGTYKALFERAEQDPVVAERFMDLIHTSDMTKRQLAEAMTEWDHWAGSKGIVFTHPEDLIWSLQMEEA